MPAATSRSSSSRCSICTSSSVSGRLQQSTATMMSTHDMSTSPEDETMEVGPTRKSNAKHSSACYECRHANFSLQQTAGRLHSLMQLWPGRINSATQPLTSSLTRCLPACRSRTAPGPTCSSSKATRQHECTHNSCRNQHTRQVPPAQPNKCIQPVAVLLTCPQVTASIYHPPPQGGVYFVQQQPPARRTMSQRCLRS
jgi:hypothetical protein